MNDEAECLCDEIDPSDRPCLVCEAHAYLAPTEQHPRYSAVDAAEHTMVVS